jgi:hypothetical protein
MEYSMAKSLEDHSQIVNMAYPSIRSDPANDQVNPGIGQLVSLYETIVPMRSRTEHVIEKKMEVTSDEIPSITNVNQIGTGDKSLDSTILESFQHPIITDSIIFPKTENLTKKQKRSNSLKTDAKPPKIRKVDHKFTVV